MWAGLIRIRAEPRGRQDNESSGYKQGHELWQSELHRVYCSRR
jgi:hypothetical protein